MVPCMMLASFDPHTPLPHVWPSGAYLTYLSSTASKGQGRSPVRACLLTLHHLLASLVAYKYSRPQMCIRPPAPAPSSVSAYSIHSRLSLLLPTCSDLENQGMPMSKSSKDTMLPCPTRPLLLPPPSRYIYPPIRQD